MIFEQIQKDDFEQIVFCNDNRVGLKAIIAMHSTALGPGVGGCRMWDYGSDKEALYDVLRLSKGMTYKASISGLEWGGGKSVIFGDPSKSKSPEMLKRFGEYVDRLGGNYVTAKDVGIGAEDLKTIKTTTRHVLGIEGESGSSGDPSPATAWGTYHGMRAAVKFALGAESLKGLTIAVQGLGSVAYYMLKHLAKDGARIVGCDVNQTVIDRAVKEYGVEIVSPDAIYDVKCDVFSPNALGATINSKTRPRIKAKIIAGAANNQLELPEDGQALMKDGITYAPDYAINAGGLINIYYEGHERGGYDKQKAFAHVERIGSTVMQILERSKAERLPPNVIADKMAEERVAAARNRRR